VLFLILSLIAGMLLGLAVHSDKIKHAAAYIQKYGLFVMVFFLGLGLGLDKAVLQNLGTAGLYAALFAALCIGGSILFSLIYERIRKGFRS